MRVSLQKKAKPSLVSSSRETNNINRSSKEARWPNSSMGGREVGFSLVAFKGNLTNVPDSNVWKCSVLLPEWNRIQQDRVGWDGMG